MFASPIALAKGVGKSSGKTIPTSKLIQQLSSGNGAARLVSHVKSLRLELNKKPGSSGEREFLRNVLPRVAFANPQLPIDISYFEGGPQKERQSRKKRGLSSDAPSSSSSASATPAGSAVAESAGAAGAEAQAQGVQPVGQEGQAAQAGASSNASSLTIEFANIPARKIAFENKAASVIVRELLDAAKSPEQPDANETIPRPIGYDAKAEAAKAEAAAQAALEAEAAAEALAESAKSSTASYADEAEVATAEEPTATNLTGSAEGLSDVDGVAQSGQKVES